MRTKIDFMDKKIGNIDIAILDTAQVLDLLEIVTNLKENLEIRLNKDSYISPSIAQLIRSIQTHYSEMLRITGFTPEGESMAEHMKNKLAYKYEMYKELDKMPKFRADDKLAEKDRKAKQLIAEIKEL